MNATVANTTPTVAQHIIEIIARVLRVDKSRIVPTASFKSDLGADDSRMCMIIVELENEFGLEISDDVAENLVTVQDVIKLVERHHPCELQSSPQLYKTKTR